MKVLIATDGSACSVHAVREALRLLPLRGAMVALVGVTPPIGLDPMAGMAPYPAVAIAPMPDEADTLHHLEAARQLLEAAGLHPLLLPRDGDPATEIVAAAKAWDADVVVLGSHGRGALGRLLLGSVTDAVAHRWAGATLIVPPRGGGPAGV